MVRNNILPTKSADLQRQEKYFNEFEKEIIANDQKSDEARKEIENYTRIQANMQAYFNNELTINMDLHEHRELSAFLKLHVSPTFFDKVSTNLNLIQGQESRKSCK